MKSCSDSLWYQERASSADLMVCWSSRSLFNGLATCGIWVYGSWGRHRQAELELPQLPKWWKVSTLRIGYFSVNSLLEKAVFSFTSSIPCESLRLLPHSTLPLYLDSQLTPRASSRQSSNWFREHFMGLQLVAKPLAHHPDWQPTTHPCPRYLLTQNLEPLFWWNHFLPPLTAGSSVLQAVVYGFLCLCYLRIRILGTFLAPKYLSKWWHLDWFQLVRRYILIHIHWLSHQWNLWMKGKGSGLPFWSRSLSGIILIAQKLPAPP